MNKPLSIYLNMLRAASAILVVLSHLSQGRLASAPFAAFHNWELGHDAVIVFFVLSGYVVGFSAEHKKKSARSYIVARSSRMLSCLVPLLVVAPLLYIVGRHIDPYLYADPTAFYSPEDARTFLETLTFTQEYELQTVAYFGDLPLWSLSYEAAYYILFGFIFYLRGAKRSVAVGLAVLLMGPKIMLLAPLWFAGCAISHWRDKLLLSRKWAVRILLATILLFPAYVAFHMFFYPRFFYVLTLVGTQHTVLNQSHFFPTDYLLCVIVCAHIVAARSLLHDRFRWPNGFADISNWLADRSFSIYVFHFPLLYFAAAILGRSRFHLAGGLIMLLIALGGSILLAHISDLRKREWRNFVETLVYMYRKLPFARRTI